MPWTRTVAVAVSRGPTSTWSILAPGGSGRPAYPSGGQVGPARVICAASERPARSSQDHQIVAVHDLAGVRRPELGLDLG